MFTGTSPSLTENTPFSAGDPLAFNIHIKPTDPNPVKLFAAAYDVEVVTGLFHLENGDFDQGIIDKAVNDFFAKLKADENRPRSHAVNTIMPGDDTQFNTAYAWVDGTPEHRRVTHEDLEAVKTGAETWVVLSILYYVDGGVTHHLRRCTWLTPPGSPQSIWHMCGGKFPDSD